MYAPPHPVWDMSICDKHAVCGKKTAHAPPVVVPPEGVQTHALGKVPHPYTLVLAVAEEQVLAGVEQHRGHVVVVPATRVHLPRLFTNRGN